MASVKAIQHKEKVARAYAVMESIGLQRPTITPILRQLLKIYNHEWEFIEAENYRLLADQAFEQQESQANKSSSSGPVTRARQAHAEMDIDDIPYESPVSSPRGPTTGGHSETPSPSVRVKVEHSAPVGRADETLAVNVARGIDYHSGPNVRIRGGQDGRSLRSMGNRGRGTDSNTDPLPTHEEKGKMLLVADQRVSEPRRHSQRKGRREMSHGAEQIINQNDLGNGNYDSTARGLHPGMGVIVSVKMEPQDVIPDLDRRLNKMNKGNIKRGESNGMLASHAPVGLQLVSHRTSDSPSICPPVDELLLITAGPIDEQNMDCRFKEDDENSLPLVDYESEEDIPEPVPQGGSDGCDLPLVPFGPFEPVDPLDIHVSSQGIRPRFILNKKGPGVCGNDRKSIVSPTGPQDGGSTAKRDIGDVDRLAHPKRQKCGAEPEGKALVVFETRAQGETSLPLKQVKVEPGAEDFTEPPRQLQTLQLKKKKASHDPADISRGTERIPIPFVNEYTSETITRNFKYVPSNVVFQDAYINISLARIGDEDCCLRCIGDCLKAPHSCACTRETGGEFAYTEEGLLKPEYIKYEVDRNQDPDLKSKPMTFCHSSLECPIERAKNDKRPDKCKGHVVRKFVKECWHKCGCSMACGNRVVQRGISRKLEVFFTNDGKGWGIRTTEDLPAGAFVCEYVGEVMTNMELDDRNQEMKKIGAQDFTGDHKDTYPVLLDGDWCSERGLKDEEALCLDATNYGNVARFINHRCFDANLVDIPVTIESQDRHYYHVAFFTNRNVSAGEELNWDYKIDFEDNDHPIEAFKCFCKSEHCRGVRTVTGKRNKK